MRSARHRSTDPYLLIASAIIAATTILVALIFLHWYRIPNSPVNILGISHTAVHWIGWSGTLYIAIVTPLYSLVKRHFTTHLRAVLKAHVLGNLLAVMLVSIHFAHQVTRPTNSYPELGTGVVLYVTMVLLETTGFLLYFGLSKRLVKQLRFLHPSVALAFYLTIIMHVIHSLS